MNQPHAPEQHASCNLQESNGRRPHNIAAVAALYCAIGDYALFALSALMMYTLEQMPYHPANVLMLIASGLLFLAALPVARLHCHSCGSWIGSMHAAYGTM